MARPSLVDRLSDDSRFVLLSAPAGFGKTTLLARWLAGADMDGTADEPTVAWVTLDDGDRDGPEESGDDAGPDSERQSVHG